MYELGLPFQDEKMFNNLKFKSYLKLDFYFEIGGRGFVIEFDGEQHKRHVKYFHKTWKEFEEAQYRDFLKDEYCRKNNLTLLRFDTLDYWYIIFTIKAAIKQETGIDI